ncbi:NAD(P)-dependent oxidoreductase [Albimonas sp. CAU 1670]|uniref:precorrin-2 dehydrogenase/sirohydrochlorin ferrochelatase family protein n=1 Tax=Albimonas sp. CAU 1670 TaxID=3032599 RepID=UPI0023DCD92F|nr:NAD(P)-dependent oxidoreductase [Albimonas sp. CAU 1670]MDF2232039.1 NAD(P)-dependent oxidoreductase [Albimonas sp. CAU 1670]
MRYFPLFLDLRGRRVLIRGGGETAAQKARLFLRTEAEVTVMWPELNEELAGLVAQGRLRHLAVRDDRAALAGAYLAIGASDVDPDGDAELARKVRRWGRVVNIVDRPDLCTAITPAIVDRDPLVVAIGTEGVAPVLAQRVKTLAESFLSSSTGPFLAGLAQLRPRMMARELEPSPRAFWNWIMDVPRLRAEAGDVEGALDEVRAAIEAGRAPVSVAARLSLLELPPEVDLMPLRAVRRMQEADLVAHPLDAPAAALELARRDAERSAADPLDLGAVGEALADGGRVAALARAGEMAAAEAALSALGTPVEVIRSGGAGG